MSPQGGAARDLVAKLIAHEAQTNNLAGSDGTAVASAFARVSWELSHWVGADGCRALVGRALRQSQSSHPALSNVTIRSHSRPALEGVPEGIAAHGDAAMGAGIESVLVDVFESLDRLIGVDMSLKLAELSMGGGVVTTEQAGKGGRAG